MEIENLEKVLERLGITENATLALKCEDGGKIRVTSLLLGDWGRLLGMRPSVQRESLYVRADIHDRRDCRYPRPLVRR